MEVSSWIGMGPISDTFSTFCEMVVLRMVSIIMTYIQEISCFNKRFIYFSFLKLGQFKILEIS